jgi:hypothetical protein
VQIISDNEYLQGLIQQNEFRNGYMAGKVDAVASIVLCKDCKNYEAHKPKVLENCQRNGYLIPMKPYDFCSYGEMRSNAFD